MTFEPNKKPFDEHFHLYLSYSIMPFELYLLLFVIALDAYTSRAAISVYSTNEIWTKSGITYRRPPWSGNVSIRYDYDESQILSVHGIILPISTAERPDAPNPYNGAETGTASGLDKGHVMALSNGGPDVSFNIVPQTAQWQRNGGWRKMEEVLFDHAMSKYGFNHSAIFHAAEIEVVPNVGKWNYVTLNLSMMDYDPITGEPMKYQALIQSGNDLIYTFILDITEPRSCMGSTWSASKQRNLHRIDCISIVIANCRWYSLSS